ncbi:TRAP transporter small permease subunit [uncultured Sulfitobacter sp.]|uniref:TRAP transporter small permease subunit n=1 Tax=uncultured Sulfitobacter sp. TaxID=191468 RepID=UPI002627CA4C|nr:TRAP transporter small permease [uncultured Sulfitobacter sp.]
MRQNSGGIVEWVIPMAFVGTMSWLIWHLPAFMLDWIPYTSESLRGQVEAIYLRADVTPNMAGIFGGHIDFLDMAALILSPVLAFFGARSVQPAAMEYDGASTVDRIALFIGRVTMMMIAVMTIVMLYEVFMRYILERPTEWANEMTLWFASFVFLTSGFYAMQQRCHIRIFLIYDMVPRWLQRVFDTFSCLLIVIFAFALVYGSYKQVFVNKLYKWELYGSAFNPPIPATLQPMVLIMISLVAIQAVLNLIADWNKEPEIHTDEPDQEEIEMLKRAVGQD